MRPELFHVGIVVPDIAVAQEHLTDLLGVGWGPVIETPALELRDAEGGDLVLPNRMCYSSEPPYLELIEEVPGSVWTCNELSNLHHIGYFAPDLATESGRLSQSACPLQLAGRHEGDAPVMFAYHRDPLGIRLELVDEALRAGVAAMATGGGGPGLSGARRRTAPG